MLARLQGLSRKVTFSAIRDWLTAHHRRFARWAAVTALLLLYGWALLISLQPARVAVTAVSLAEVGYPDVAIKITHPRWIGPATVGPAARPLTVWARADAATASAPITVVVAPVSDALSLVDRTGAHVSGRVTVTPGFPEWTPIDLWLVYGETPAATQLFGSHRVEITPAVVTADGVMPVRALSFAVTVDGRARQAFRWLARLWVWALPLVALAIVLAAGATARWERRHREVRVMAERQLAGRYVQLRSHIKLEQWEQARQEIDAIQTLQPEYRDVGRLDVLVSSAETASWRREQLYATGIEAYRHRQWPVAAQALSTLEQETPYYREVRFLKRTAELYADLSSRDRSLRIDAARQLGQVGDLVDMTPLIDALGDQSPEVATAVEQSLQLIGAQTADDLIGALRHSHAAVRQRSFDLLQQMGRGILDRLLAGLRSADPQVTRGVARLLAHLGAREELARALLWLEPEHHDGIRQALAYEGVAAVQPLVEVLFEAPPERRQGIINVLNGLLDQEDVRLRVETLAHDTRDPKQKALLQRALKTPVHTSQAKSPAQPAMSQADPDTAPSPPEVAEPSNLAVRLLRRLDRGQ